MEANTILQNPSLTGTALTGTALTGTSIPNPLMGGPGVGDPVPLQSQNYLPKYDYYPEDTAIPVVDFDTNVSANPSKQSKNTNKKLVISIVVLGFVVAILTILLILSCIKHAKQRKEIKRLKKETFMGDYGTSDGTSHGTSHDAPHEAPNGTSDRTSYGTSDGMPYGTSHGSPLGSPVIIPPSPSIQPSINLLPPRETDKNDDKNDDQNADQSAAMKAKYLSSTSLDAIKDNVNNDVDVVLLQEKRESAIYDFSSNKKKPVIVQPKTQALVTEPDNPNVLKFDVSKVNDSSLEV